MQIEPKTRVTAGPTTGRTSSARAGATAEARSRRVDAMELADPDRGPIPLPPGGADADAIALELGKNAED